ncbi:hypothetical protein P0Y67_07895 [Photobacterium sp. SP02]|uniref:hypothetical protein n=1 Tax=Photobacterium sp. SP02 TaxID=3032280 RepID=UPI0031453DDC
MKKTLHPTWLTCENCGSDKLEVITEKGNEEWLYSGDFAKCLNCSAVGSIEADGESAWFEANEENHNV